MAQTLTRDHPPRKLPLGQRLEQHPSLLEIGGVEALRKPAVDRG
jgi:hypothetical protein